MDIVIAHIVALIALIAVIVLLIAVLKTVDWDAAWIMLLFILACFVTVGFMLGIVWAIKFLIAFYGGDV